jgi:hypothetical protein
MMQTQRRMAGVYGREPWAAVATYRQTRRAVFVLPARRRGDAPGITRPRDHTAGGTMS